MTVGQMAREVVGAEHGDHAVRLVAHEGLGTRHGILDRAGALIMGADGDGDLALHGGHFGTGLPQRLAGFAGDGQRQRFFVLTEQVGIAAHDVQTRLKTQIRPMVEGGASGLDGGIHLGLAGGLPLPYHFILGRIP